MCRYCGRLEVISQHGRPLILCIWIVLGQESICCHKLWQDLQEGGVDQSEQRCHILGRGCDWVDDQT